MAIKWFEKKYFYVEMAIVVILVIYGALFRYASVVQEIAQKQCFSILDDSREQMGQMVVNEMLAEQGHLESASSLLKDLLPEYEKNRELILQIMNASSAQRSYAHWEICLPDERIIQSNGTNLELRAGDSFEERIRDEFVVSERRTALTDGKTPIIMLSKCIFNEGKCIGILSSVIDVNAFSEHFFAALYRHKTEVLLFERGTGDILIDSWNDGLGNIEKMKAARSTKGFNWIKTTERYEAGQQGHGAFFSERANEKMYLSYSPISYSDWEILVFAPDSVCMATAHVNRKAAYQTIFTILAAFGLFAVTIGISENRSWRRQREQEEKLREALACAKRANAAKSDFLSRMSHDIRTPLNGVIGCLEIAQAHPDDPELLAQNRQKARTAAQHLLTLINDILNMSKLEEDKVELAHEVFDIRKLAEDVLVIGRILAEESGIRLECEHLEQIPYPYVYGSPLHLREIFVNILSNAIKYNRPGGSVRVRFELVRREGNCVYYACSISDTGIGMSPEFLERLFDPFSQERVDARSVYQGSGLGMAIVKALVDKMGGTIQVKSTQGVGTEFQIIQPFEIGEEIQTAKEEPPSVTAASLKGVHVLLAEDNELNREIAAELLEDQGAVVTSVENGEEAVTRFRTSPPRTFDVILMDIMMPVLDGLSAARQIRLCGHEDSEKIPIIALTANAFFEDVKKCREAGMDAHLAKPIELEKMLHTISGLVNGERMYRQGTNGDL